MRFLITGRDGLLAAAIQAEFHGEEVIAFDHAALDVTDDHAVTAAIADARPDVIVNCTAFNGVDAAEDAPVAALTVNAFAVRSLARAAAAHGAVLVHYSSDFVFDGETDRPYTEEDEPNPRSVYAASKLLGDWFALGAPRAYVFRVESLFGKPGSTSARRGSLQTLVDRISAGEEVPVFTDRTVSPTYTRDAARATGHILRRNAPFGLYHCVNSGQATWMQIAERIAGVLGKPLRSRPLTLETAKLRAYRPRFCALANGKLTIAGFEMPSWEDALRDFLRG
jgi:dTDP-4-dehydrorhamnose reductase